MPTIKETVVDWKGNEFKVGDTLCIFITQIGEQLRWVKVEPEAYLILKEPLIVQYLDLENVITVNGIDWISNALWAALNELSLREEDGKYKTTICIKGKSDDENEYYDKYFEA